MYAFWLKDHFISVTLFFLTMMCSINLHHKVEMCTIFYSYK